MAKDKFDFMGDIDAAIQTAEKSQEESRLRQVAEYQEAEKQSAAIDRYRKTVEALGERMETVAGKIPQVVTELKRTGDAFRQADRIVISTTLFWCLIILLLFLTSTVVCVFVANEHLLQSSLLWKILGYNAIFLTASLSPDHLYMQTVLVNVIIRFTHPDTMNIQLKKGKMTR